ncbi:FG-GAP repeat domain-containing protein [Aquirufa nivalisilvae]
MSNNMRLIAALFLLSSAFISCRQSAEEKSEALAKETCSSCHKFPDPSLLDKKTWKEGVLPEMGYRLGIGDRFQLMTRISEEQYQSALAMDIYPLDPKISEEDWQSIIDYYVKNAPEKPLPQKQRSPISTSTLHFKEESYISKKDPLGVVISLRIHPDKPEVWAGTRNRSLWVLDANKQIKNTIETQSPVALTQILAGNPYLLAIGKMYPNDEKIGTMYGINPQGKMEAVIDSLKRPVDVQISDFNSDGVQDFVICEYGFERGQLTWIDGKNKSKHLLKAQAGARNVVIKDYTGDGKPDLLVLMAQSREGVSLFINKGQGIFVEKPLLQFDSVFGSSYMEVADMNKDGYDDIIVSNGDNADYSRSKKAFHGVHVYLNDGRNNFKEGYFYPSYGASKTVARDFDQDGDLDLAMIAFFAENDKGRNENFLYFQNQGNMTFQVSNLNIGNGGHYICMDAGDVDKDGDIDIVLGNYQFGAVKPGTKLTPGLQLTYFKNLIR